MESPRSGALRAAPHWAPRPQAAIRASTWSRRATLLGSLPRPPTSSPLHSFPRIVILSVCERSPAGWSEVQLEYYGQTDRQTGWNVLPRERQPLPSHLLHCATLGECSPPALSSVDKAPSIVLASGDPGLLEGTDNDISWDGGLSSLCP